MAISRHGAKTATALLDIGILRRGSVNPPYVEYGFRFETIVERQTSESEQARETPFPRGGQLQIIDRDFRDRRNHPIQIDRLRGVWG